MPQQGGPREGVCPPPQGPFLIICNKTNQPWAEF